MNGTRRNEDYARNMRLALSDTHISKPDGSINHQYFLVKKGQFWSEEMEQQLISHIQNDGVGNWKASQRDLLEKTSDIELELRTCLLFKTSDISQYLNKKYSSIEIQRIAKENIAKGTQNNRLKYGLYVV